MRRALFRWGLNAETKKLRATAAPLEPGESAGNSPEGSDDDRGDGESLNLETDPQGFVALSTHAQGRLAGLLFAEAAQDGVSRIQFHYANERMVYTIAQTDYDMIPPPAPLYADFVRRLAQTANLRDAAPGRLKVHFADAAAELDVEHVQREDERYVEVRGFERLRDKPEADSRGG